MTELIQINFEEVFIYSFAEPGAMGAAGTMELFTANGKEFMMNYLSEETPYEEIKKNFSGLADVYFNGPAPKEETYAEEIVLYPDNDKRNFRRTHVTPRLETYIHGIRKSPCDKR